MQAGKKIPASWVSLGLTKALNHDISMGFDFSLVQNLILWPTEVHFYSIQISKYFWSPFVCELLQRTQTEVIQILKITIHLN